MPLVFTETGKAVRISHRPVAVETKRQIMQHIADGQTVDSTAQLMHYSPETIKSYMRQLYVELGVHSQAHAVAVMMRNGWIK